MLLEGCGKPVMLLENFLEGSVSLWAAVTCFLIPHWENCPFAALPLQLRLCKNPHIVWKYQSNLNRDCRKVPVGSAAHFSTQAAPPCLFQECHRPSPVPCLHLPALRGQEGGRPRLCPCPHRHTGLCHCPVSPFNSPRHRKVVPGHGEAGQPAPGTKPLPKALRIPPQGFSML